MKKPLLSICIPTYNRCEYLKKSIESIVRQKEFLDGDVEIVVSDNASNDNTRQTVKDCIDKFGNGIKYYRNNDNIKDRNFPMVLSEGSGALRKLSNDTVVYRENSLGYMCDIIRNNRMERPFVFWSGGNAKIHDDICKMNFRGFVRDVSYWITYIAYFSIWEDDYKNIENDISGCNLRLWQVYMALKIASERDNVLVCNKNITSVQNVPGKDISYGLYEVFYKNYFKLFEIYFENGSLADDDKDFLEKDLLFNFFMNFCVDWKMKGSQLKYSENENLENAIKLQYQNKPYWNEYLEKYERKLKEQIK